MLCTAASAQFVSIETRTDFPGKNCGAPGNRGCAVLPTCSQPTSNILRDDEYIFTVLCELPGSALDETNQGSLPLILQQYNLGQIVPGDTIFTSTDLHFGKASVSNADHVRHTRFLNQFATSGTHWPRGVGFPDEAIHVPAAVITTGDNAHDGQSNELGAYRLLYEQSLITESINLPVFVGLGNHDVDNQCQNNNCAQRMFDYEAGHVQGGVRNFDILSDNYSWDWNGVHYIQLNTWAGDTQLGGSGALHVSGLAWLSLDLANNVGISNRPVIIFQHFGVDRFSEQVILGLSQWWTPTDRQQFWTAIQGYNVIGMFTGHIHATGMYDFNETGGHLDDFVGGTGGEDPCNNYNEVTPAPPQIPGCGGRGHFFAIRVTSQFLDVASLEWVSNPDGSDLSTFPYFTNLQFPVVNGVPLTGAFINAPSNQSQGPAFVGGQAGCRKIINSRIVDVSRLVNNVGTVNGGVSPITITNTSQSTIPGPLALEFAKLGDSDNLTSKSFVDRCANNTASTANGSQFGGSSFMYPDNSYSGGLAPGASLTFTPSWLSGPPGTVDLMLVRAGFSKGASPAAVVLTGTPTNVPGPGTISVYGPPNTPFSIANSVQTKTKNWISVTSASGSFDQFGVATLTYTLNAAALSKDAIDASEITFVAVTTSDLKDEVGVVITLNLRVSDTINVKIAPSNQLQTGQQAIITATIAYTPVVNTNDGGIFLATGVMTLNDITNPVSSVVLTSGNVNSNCDSTNDPNCPQEPDNTVILPAVTLSAGIRTLQVSYNGDSFYTPNTSAPFQISMGTPQVTLLTQPSSLELVLDGARVATPSTRALQFLSNHILSVPTPQLGNGVRYLFSGWSDETPAGSRTITVNQTSASYTADFETQYQLTLTANPANAGTVAASDVHADPFYPDGSVETLTAVPSSGFFFKGFSGDLSTANNGASITLNGPKNVTADFGAQKILTINWVAPTAILFGSALGPQQLNASLGNQTAAIPGMFVYSPAAGTVLPVGAGQTLSVTFTPTDTTYAAVTASTTITVNPVAPPSSPANLVITKTLTRNGGNVVLQLTIANTGGTAAANVVLTSVKVGVDAGTPLPQSLGSIGPGISSQATVSVPGSVGAAGAAGSLTVSGTYAGGTFSSSARITLP